MFGLFKIIKGLLISEEGTLTPKQIEIIPGGSASTKTSLVSSQTADRTITLPNATDTLVGRATTDTLTNKTIVVANSTITTAASGNLVATELNAALAELDSQDTTNATAISDHIADTTDAHDASAISNVPSGNLIATDVQGALNEIQTELDTKASQTALTDHINDTTAAHAASAISNTPGGNLTSTNVDSSLSELQSDIDTRVLTTVYTNHVNSSTVHGVSGAVVGTSDSQTLSNKVIDNTNTVRLNDNLTNFEDQTDNTKKFKFEAAGITTGNTRVYTVPNADTTLVGTGTTDSLTNKTISDALTFAEIATPTTPASGFGKVYFKNDNYLYQLNDSGTETRVGAGSSSEVNYIGNPDAENDTSGWATYADAAASSPVDGTGGSPNVTWTRSTSSPLRGTASFLFTKDAANRQGQGVSYAFTIAAADKAKVLSIELPYMVSSGTFTAGTATTDSDLTVWIYDVTNSLLIQPTSFRLLSNSSTISDKLIANFQTASNSTSYRLILHCATTSASAYVVQFDDIKVRPTSYNPGTIISDWQSYPITLSASITPPTPNGAAIQTYRSRRVGDSEEIYYTFSQTAAGSAGSGVYLIPLRSGLTADTNKVTTDSGAIGALATVLGSARTANTQTAATATGVNGHVVLQNSTHLKIVMNNAASNNLVQWGDSFQQLNGAAYASFHAIVPISGWSSSAQATDTADQRIVFASYYPNVNVTGDSTTPFNWNTKREDTHNAVTTGSAWKFTAPVPGVYSLSLSAVTTGATTSAILYVNGVALTRIAGLGSAIQESGEVKVKLNAGDYIDVRPIGSTTLDGSTALLNRIEIFKAPGAGYITATETVSAKYRSSAGNTFTNGAFIVADFATRVEDSHGAVTTGSGWKFTAPIAGKYRIVSKISTGTFSYATGNSIGLQIRKTDLSAVQTTESQSTFTCQAAATQPLYLDIVDTVILKAGEFLQVYMYIDSGSGRTLDTTAYKNYVTIERVGL